MFSVVTRVRLYGPARAVRAERDALVVIARAVIWVASDVEQMVNFVQLVNAHDQ